MSENGTYKYREPPKVTWDSRYGKGERPPEVFVVGKGIVAPIRVRRKDQRNLIVPDIVEIGGIDYLRKERYFYEALSLANTHADFQCKRILKLLLPELTPEEKQILFKVLKSHKKLKRIQDITTKYIDGIDTFYAIRCLLELVIIDKQEWKILDSIRDERNKLQHDIEAKYRIDTRKIDKLLKDCIQVLLRLRELPL